MTNTINYIAGKLPAQCGKWLLAFCMATGLLLFSSCKKFVEVDPPDNQLINAAVFTNDKTATSALMGIYTGMTGNFGGFANWYTTLLGGLSADEFINYSAGEIERVALSNNSLSATNSYVSGVWSEAYKFIYQANSIIENSANSTGMTPAVKKQLRGEALFIRAFCHFYLVNFFGGVPYITATDYKANSGKPRLPVPDVYAQMIADLLEAQTLLEEGYSVSGNERIRPNKGAATALLARAYLYSSDWTNAEKEATKLINNSSLYSLLTNVNDVFIKNSSETIWQLLPVFDGINTIEGYSLGCCVISNQSLNEQLVNAFAANDTRGQNWIGTVTDGSTVYYYPVKYKKGFDNNLTEYYTVLRLAEQYLIRAEARAKLDNTDGAKADLDVIRNRAGLSNTAATTKPAILLAIEQERRLEFFSEWGHRWFDLKRTDRANAVLSVIKSGWQPDDQLYPIPAGQLLNAPGFPQNPGY